MFAAAMFDLVINIELNNRQMCTNRLFYALEKCNNYFDGTFLMEQRRGSIVMTLNVGALAGYYASVFCMDNWMEIMLKDANGDQYYNNIIGYFNVNHLSFKNGDFDRAAVLLLHEITRLTKLADNDLNCVAAEQYDNDGYIEEKYDQPDVAMVVPPDDNEEPYEDGIVQVSRLAGNMCNYLRRLNSYFI